LAGSLSTVIFMASYLPMLVKAFRTRDLSSYSIGNLVLIDVGNAMHSVYVYSLPAGPIWVLHSVYLAAGALMTIWYLRFTHSTSEGRRHADQPVSTLSTFPAGSRNQAMSGPWPLTEPRAMPRSSVPKSSGAS
jgi:uncharacterized protein with PQ loop repeat